MVHPYPPYCATFNYVGKHAYLLTLVTFQRNTIFIEEDVVSFVRKQILRACAEKQFEILAYCFMPDHLHLIVEGMSQESDLKVFAKLAKQYSGYYYRRAHPKHTLWQHGGNDHIIRDEVDLLERLRYVINNPVAAGLVDDPEDYPFWGSQRWTRAGLLERCRVNGWKAGKPVKSDR